MKKYENTRKLMASMLAMLMLSFVTLPYANAMTIRPLLNEEQLAYGGATHVVTITHEDLTQTADNTAQTLTMDVKAKQSVELVAMVLDTAFDTNEDSHTGSCLLKIGDGTDDDLYLTSTELAEEGTEVFLKFAPAAEGTVASTPTLSKATFVTGITLQKDGANVTNVTVATADAVTNTTVASTYTAAVRARKVYTADDTVDFVFTPNAEEDLEDNIQGQVRVYFRIWDAR